MSYLQFNLLAQFPEITHGVFTRSGGYSQEPYRGLNISMSGGDNPDNVFRNRLLTLQTLQLKAYPCATLWLVHGADVATLGPDATWDDWRSDWPYRSFCVEQQEVIWTILFYDPVQHVLGMAHAGWRGTARGTAAATVEAMSEQFGSRPGDMRAGIGPSIGPCCYEVSSEVQQLFEGKAQFAEMPTAERYRNLVRESSVFAIRQRPDGSPSLRLDLWRTNRNQLLMAGLLPEHIELPEVCTSCNTDRFFSYRGEFGKTGRFPALLAFREK